MIVQIFKILDKLQLVITSPGLIVKEEILKLNKKYQFKPKKFKETKFKEIKIKVIFPAKTAKEEVYNKKDNQISKKISKFLSENLILMKFSIIKSF